MIDELKSLGVLRTPRIVAAFQKIDRKVFVPSDLKYRAYENIPLPIGHGQTISQPLTVAIMLEALQPKAGDRVLDVGAGSGWVSALLGDLVGPNGRVMGIERIPMLAAQAQKNLAAFTLPQVRVMAGDASRGWPRSAPYDLIHVAAAAPDIPKELLHQLVPGGRLIIPVGEPVQDLALITKKEDNTFSEHRIPGFQFVPLISSAR